MSSSLPPGWRVTPLGEHVCITSGESPSLFEFVSDGTPYFKVEQLGSSNKYLGHESTPYQIRTAKTVPRHSVVFAKRGAAISLNRIRVLRHDSYMDTNLMALTPSDDLSVEYLYYGLGHIGLWQLADTTSVPQINNKHIQPLPFPLPPIEEQRAIAEALSDVDALLAGVDRLIAKKRDLKQAAMQQLLTGQTRLKGFRMEWSRTTLGELFTFKNGLNKAKHFFGSGTPIVNYMDVFLNGRILCTRLVGRVSLSKQELSNFDVRQGDVLFTRTSETPEEVGLAAVVGDEPSETVFSGFLLRGRPRSRVLCDEFKAYCFRSSFVRLQIVSKASYTTRALTNGRLLSGVVLPVPPLAEQAAIAAALSAMDTEILALETRRDKTRALKQAMMQELLTGRIRLI